LNKAGLALVPGSVYGKNGEGYLRLSLAAGEEDLKEGFNRFSGWIKNYEHKKN
jgi:aspartate/methionine/tyrosine aminotransferase